MSRDEYQQLVHHTESLEEEIALRLMGDCGLRIGEVGDVSYSHVKRMPDGSGYKLRVVHGKDTTGELDEGKFRETWLPDGLERWLYRYKSENELNEDEELITVTRRTLNNWVDYAAEGAAEETGDDDYRKLSSHDLRRQWAQHLLVEQRVNPRVVMSLGGWSSYDAIEPYLNAPTDSHIAEEMEAVF
ncbi:site-specific integrase [Natrinema versiforme]|nr:site-specific integrase [Natrinema versiforme]